MISLAGVLEFLSGAALRTDYGRRRLAYFTAARAFTTSGSSGFSSSAFR
jgi:hypothetical protein